jgi:hypothetical protein
MKSRRMRYMQYVESRGAYRVLVGIHEKIDHLEHVVVDVRMLLK